MSLFDNGQETPIIDENKDYFSELVGEGKKFKTEKDLARAKVESDAFIERLQNETKGLRDELRSRVDSETSAARLAELVDKLAQAKAPPANNEPPTNENRERGVESREQAPVWTPEKIEELLETKLKTMTASQKAEANVSKVKTELQKKFGPGYATHVRSQAEALNMSLPSLEKLAQEAPDAFLRLVAGTSTASVPVNPPVSSVSGFVPDISGKRTKSFYDKIKQAEPSKYWESKTQNQMHKDAIAMGDAFFDT